MPNPGRPYNIAFAAQAELMTFLQLGWDMPRRIFDLFVEYRHLNNEFYRLQEMKAQKAFGLLAAASHYGIHLESLPDDVSAGE